jgi:hypothetical protein
MKYKLLAIALAFAVNPALSHDEANCASISNLLARLACYDNDHTKVQSSGDELGIEKTASPLPKMQVGSASGSSNDNSSFGDRGDFFGASGDTFLESNISDVQETSSRRSRLVLTNGQAWELTKARAVSASEGDKIEIRRGTVGGYFASVERGSWFRVKRVE